MDRNSLGIMFAALSEWADRDKALIEARKGERAIRLAEFVQSDVWQLDILPILTGLHDDYLTKVKEKSIDPDALKVIDDLIGRIDSSIRVGAGAMERLAAKRVVAAKIAQQANSRSAPVPLSD